MLPDRVSNPGPLTNESGALPIALRELGSWTNLPNTHHGDYTEWRLNTLQNTLKKQTKEAMGGQ